MGKGGRQFQWERSGRAREDKDEVRDKVKDEVENGVWGKLNFCACSFEFRVGSGYVALNIK
jgi:hypothetical protein